MIFWCRFREGYRDDIPAISRKEERQKARDAKKDAGYWPNTGASGQP
jgi:hypothetical protein